MKNRIAAMCHTSLQTTKVTNGMVEVLFFNSFFLAIPIFE